MSTNWQQNSNDSMRPESIELHLKCEDAYRSAEGAVSDRANTAGAIRTSS